jgi:hypothetical protein
MKRASSFTPRDHLPAGVATIRGLPSSSGSNASSGPAGGTSPPLHARSKSTNSMIHVSIGAGLAALTAPPAQSRGDDRETAETKRESILDTLISLNRCFVIGSPVVAALEKVGTWEWDLFHFYSVAGGRPLSLLCAHLFSQLDVYSPLKVTIIFKH